VKGGLRFADKGGETGWKRTKRLRLAGPRKEGGIKRKGLRIG